MKKKMPLLYVEFLDHGTGAQWMDMKDINLKEAMFGEDQCVRAVGWLYAEDKDTICLISFWAGTMCHNRQYIVKGGIRKRKTLKCP